MSNTDLFDQIEIETGATPNAGPDDLNIDITAIQKLDSNPAPDKPATDEIEIQDIITDDAPIDQRSSPFSKLAKAFIDRGHLPDDEELLKKFNEIKDFDEFAEVFDNSIQSPDVKALSDVQKEYLESLKVGLPQKSFDEYATALYNLKQATPENLAKNTSFAETVARSYYQTKDITEDDELAPLVSAAIAKPENLTKMVSHLSDHYQKLHDTEKAKWEDQTNNTISTQTQSIDDLKKVVNDKELFPGLKLTDTMKQKVIDAATNIVTKDGEKPMTAFMKAWKDNPNETNAKLSYIWEMTKGLTTLNGFNRKSMTEATKAMEQLATRSTMGSVFSDTPDVRRDIQEKSKSLTDVVRLALNS